MTEREVIKLLIDNYNEFSNYCRENQYSPLPTNANSLRDFMLYLADKISEDIPVE